MALQKEITTPKGVKLNYHRISTINNNHGLVDVGITSYVSEEYRLKEEELSEISSSLSYYLNEVERLQSLEELTEEEQKFLAETEVKLNEFHLNNNSSDRSVVSNYYTFRIDDADNLSFAEIYAKVKEEIDDFKDATDV